MNDGTKERIKLGDVLSFATMHCLDIKIENGSWFEPIRQFCGDSVPLHHAGLNAEMVQDILIENHPWVREALSDAKKLAVDGVLAEAELVRLSEKFGASHSIDKVSYEQAKRLTRSAWNKIDHVRAREKETRSVPGGMR